MELTLNPLSCFVFVGLTVESILSGIDVESIIFCFVCVGSTVTSVLCIINSVECVL